MLHKHNSLTRLLTAGLAIAAIAPAAAVAQPIDGHGTGGGSGLTQDLRAPDQQAPGQTGGTPAPTTPQWPAHPQTLTPAKSSAATKASDDGGIDTGIWIAIGAAALVAAGGLGLVGRNRLRTTRQRQLA